MHPVSLEARLEEIEEMEAWRLSLPPAPVPDFLGGVKPRPSDPRDHDLRDEPFVEALLEAGFPESADLIRYLTGPAYNQGAVPACVFHTAACSQSLFQQQEEGQWRLFDAMRAHRETGPMDQGRYPDAALSYCKERGMPLAGSETRYKIAGYAFAPKVSGEWENTIKATIASGRPVWIAYLLPSVFGWDSNLQPTQGYHESLFIGYDPTWFVLRNSWGPSWGRDGLGRLRIDYLTQGNWQNGYVLAHAVTDEGGVTPHPDPLPDPAPVLKRAIVTGKIEGEDVARLAVGRSYSLVGVGDMLVTQVVRNDTQPDPLPDPDPDPVPDPQPMGDLVVLANIVPVGVQGVRALEVRVTDGGRYITARVMPFSPGVVFPPKNTTVWSSGSIPARWALPVMPAGTAITVTATAGTKSGSVTVTA